MKRGRPNMRKLVQENLLSILTNSKTPLTISSLTRFLSNNLNKQVSWNTVQKYLHELIEANQVQAITLPHSKEDGKEGLTVYTLKK
jgi:predicted Zn-ribbon and HTH transcriptional regulator